MQQRLRHTVQRRQGSAMMRMETRNLCHSGYQASLGPQSTLCRYDNITLQCLGTCCLLIDTCEMCLPCCSLQHLQLRCMQAVALQVCS